MKTKLRSLLCSLLLAALGAAGVAAQTATPPAVADPLSALPDSDLVIYVDARRMMTELAPRILAHSPEMLAKVTGALAEVKTKTGINVLGIERIVVGVKLLGPVGPNVKKENLGIVIIAHGDFDANALVAFAKAESGGKVVEQTYEGKVVYSEPPPEAPRTRHERETKAFAVLDANTLAIGDLVAVRAAVDAAAGKGRVDPAVARLATRDPEAIIGAGVNFSPSVAQHLSASVGSDEIARAGVRLMVATVRQLSLSAGVAPGTFSLTLGARFCDAQQAQGVGDVLSAVRRKVAADEPKFAGLLEGVQVKTDGSDLLLRADIKGEALRSLGAMFAGQREGGGAPPPPAAAPPVNAEPKADPTPAPPDGTRIKPPTNQAMQSHRSRRRGR